MYLSGRFALLVLSTLFLAAPAGAQTADGAPVRGILDASSFETLPAAAAIQVRPFAAGPQSDDLSQLLRNALDAAGYETAGEGGYVLTYQLTSAAAAIREGAGFALQGEGGSRGSDELALTMRWRLQRGEGKQRRRGRLMLLTLVDRNKHPVWEARITLSGATADDFAVVGALAPGIVAELGRTAYARQIP